jgi:hypothetical protein
MLVFMSTYLVSYDLGQPETSADYHRLLQYLRSFGTRAKPLYSVWFIESNEAATTIRDALRVRVDANDKVLVIDVTDQDWASYNLPTDTAEWMQRNI